MQNLRDTYLESQVLTGTPQRLRLMLIEGAQRFARQALHHWEQGEREAGNEALQRARGVVSELMASIQPDGSALCRKVAGIYLFLYRTISEALIDQNCSAVSEAIEVLEIERETWKLVCEKHPERIAGNDSSGDSYQAGQVSGTASQYIAGPAAPSAVPAEWSSGGGFVLDA